MYIGNWELGSKYIRDWKIVRVCFSFPRCKLIFWTNRFTVSHAAGMVNLSLQRVRQLILFTQISLMVGG